MKKYFFMSDIHSYCKAALDALCISGFELDNKEHILVICGDIFDRGSESLELYKRITALPRERRILIRGNHEYLFLKLLNKEKPDYYDFSNGTVRTFCDIAKVDYDNIKFRYYYTSGTYYDTEHYSDDFGEIWHKIVKKVEKTKIPTWIRSDEWQNYFELGKYIAVHSWIPTQEISIEEMTEKDELSYYMTGRLRSHFIENWRDAGKKEWEKATWGCPWQNVLDGLTPKERTIICGHWHASAFHEKLGGEFDGGDNYNIYADKDIIALDACTAYTGFCNVLVIDEEFNCFDQYGNKLEVKERKEKE